MKNRSSKYSFALSAVIDVGGRGANQPPWLNVTTGPHLAYILVPFDFQ